VAKAKSTRHGSRRGRAPDSTSAIVCAKSAIGIPAEKEEKSRGACQKPKPPRKNVPVKDAGKDATTAWRMAAPKKRARKPHRPDALIVEPNGKTYSEVLAMVTRRDDGKLQNLSTRVNKVRRTANGNLVLELNRSEDTSTEAIKESGGSRRSDCGASAIRKREDKDGGD